MYVGHTGGISCASEMSWLAYLFSLQSGDQTVMEHNQLFLTDPMFETSLEPNHDQNRIHTDSSMHLGGAGVVDSGSFAMPMENRLPVSSWNYALSSNEYVPPTVNRELAYHQAPIPHPSYHQFRHPSDTRSFFPVTQTYADRPSSSHSHVSSNNYGHLANGYEEGSSSTSSGRNHYKRKRISGSVVHEGVGGYHSVASSSDPKPNSGSQGWPWEVVSVTPSVRGSTLSIAGEASERNVRSRPTLDLDVNQVRAHVLSNPPRYIPTSSRLMDLPSSSVRTNSRERNHIPVPADDRRRIVAAPTASSHDINQFCLGSSATTGSLDFDNYSTNVIPIRNTIIPPQNTHFSGTQAIRGARSSYIQRPIPVSRITRGHQRAGHVTTSSQRALQSVPESYPPNYSRPPSVVGWPHDRSGRSRVPFQRSISLYGASDAQARVGFMMAEHSMSYDSPAILDQHRDMRLDVDNMSYEELLALEERIGYVSTGLSEDTMSGCLREMIYYTSDQLEDESNCVICLEEYEDKDVVATLTNCGHNYHSSCVKKWLSMKKVCPICKAAVVEDD